MTRPLPGSTRFLGSVSTDGKDVGETWGDCPTWRETLTHRLSNIQEERDVNKVGLTVNGHAERSTEGLPDLESIIKGTDMIRDKLEDQYWVWAKSAGGARWATQFQGQLSETRKVLHNTLGKVCGSGAWVDLHEHTYSYRGAYALAEGKYLLKEFFVQNRLCRYELWDLFIDLHNLSVK